LCHQSCSPPHSNCEAVPKASIRCNQMAQRLRRLWVFLQDSMEKFCTSEKISLRGTLLVERSYGFCGESGSCTRFRMLHPSGSSMHAGTVWIPGGLCEQQVNCRLPFASGSPPSKADERATTNGEPDATQVRVAAGLAGEDVRLTQLRCGSLSFLRVRCPTMHCS
jgi:hypothetical protein